MNMPHIQSQWKDDKPKPVIRQFHGDELGAKIRLALVAFAIGVFLGGLAMRWATWG